MSFATMIAADVENTFINANEFAQTATYAANGGSGVSVVGVWEDGGGRDGFGTSVEEQERRRVAKRMGVWSMSVDDVATVTVDVDELTRGGFVYIVKAVTTEGGLHRCECVQKETLSVAQKDRRF